MRTDGAIITNAGLELISYAIANNKNITFTKTKLGKGDVNTFDEAKKLTDVVSFYKQIPITSISRNNSGIIRIRSTFTNEDFPTEVVLKEVGIFATVEGKSETLFAYVNDGAGESFPPGTSGNIVERVRDIYVGVSTAIEVNAIIDRSTVYATIFDLEEGLNRKEDKFTKNTGFNKNKSDSTSLDDSDTLATSKAVKLAMEKATGASTAAAGKEPKFDKNTAFNKDFGVNENQVLEGSKLAEILGIEYGGVLNNSNQKISGKGYYDTANKKIYKCTGNTSINYADAGYFIEVSNNDLLGKLQNLLEYKEISVRPPNFSSANIFVQGRHAILVIDTADALAGMTNGSVLFNIPQGFRPKTDVHYATLSSNISAATDDSATFPIVIKSNGNVEVFVVSKPLPAKAFYGCISYFI